jgi:branched-chain amino acid transport system substrate-binding protein
MRDAADALNMVYIDTNATANALSKSKYVFRTSASSWQLSEPLGEWAAKNGHIEFFVTSVDDTFGSESADAFVAGLMKSGGRATDRARIPSGGDWKKAITAILAQPTRDVFAAFYTDDAEGFLTQWNNQSASNAGYKLYGPGFLTDEEVLGQVKSAGDDVVTSLFWSPDLDTLENRTLVGTFPKEYTDEDTGEPVQLNGYAVQMWDAMTALDQALQQIGGATSNADVLIAALEAVSFKSPRGQFAFDKTTHNPIQDMYVRQVATSAAGKAVNAVIGKTASANVSS